MKPGTTPDTVLETLTRLFPAFAAQCHYSESLFANEDGTFTFCGLFCELTEFVRYCFETMPDPERTELFKFVEDCISIHDNDELDTAVCTCFLENLADGELSLELRRYIGPTALTFLDAWDNQIAEDSKAGRLDGLIQQANQDYDAGRCQPL